MFDSFIPPALSLQQYLLRTVSILLVVAVHGFLLALLARLFGDEGTRHDGRLNLNPLVHLDLVGAIAAVLYRVGWMRPMRIDADELRGGRVTLVLIVLLACAGTIAVALLAQLLKPLVAVSISGNAGLTVQSIITNFGRIGLWFGLANLLPLTPFTGGHILTAISPKAGLWLQKHLLWPTIVVALVVASGLAERIVAPAYRLLAPLATGL